MTRIPLPERRASTTLKIPYESDGGKVHHILVTVGFDAAGDIKEVFCADFKAGTSIHSIVMDACILLSRLLQHGDRPEELMASMCSPPSLIGTIAKAIMDNSLLRPRPV